jgi:hypothetical protein
MDRRSQTRGENESAFPPFTSCPEAQLLLHPLMSNQRREASVGDAGGRASLSCFWLGDLECFTRSRE